MQAFADSMAATLIVDNMSGTFVAFGVPFVWKGGIIELRDMDRAECNKKRFVVDRIVYGFGTNGYRQTITLGVQIKNGGSNG